MFYFNGIKGALRAAVDYIYSQDLCFAGTENLCRISCDINSFYYVTLSSTPWLVSLWTGR